MRENRVVITGIGIISPLGEDKESFWTGLCNGVSGIKPITLFDTSSYRCKLAGEVAGFDPKRYLGSKGLRYFDRVSLLITSAAKLALEDGHLHSGIYAEDELGAVIGSTFGSINSISAFDMESLREGPNYVSPMDFPNTVLNAPASRVSIHCEMKGLNSTVSNGETSGIDSIQYAADFLRFGRVKALLAGGVYALTPDTFWGFYEADALAGTLPETLEISAPFDRRRNGIVLGEGAAVFLLEDVESAVARGAHIYAEVRGYGTAFAPEGRTSDIAVIEAGTGAINEALWQSGIAADEISFVASGAHSSARRDRLEVACLKAVFGARARTIPVSAIRSMTGECLDASAAMQIAAAVMAIGSNRVPPTINYQEPDPDCDVDCVPNVMRELEVENVLIPTFSFTGNASCLVVSRFDWDSNEISY